MEIICQEGLQLRDLLLFEAQEALQVDDLVAVSTILNHPAHVLQVHNLPKQPIAVEILPVRYLALQEVQTKAVEHILKVLEVPVITVVGQVIQVVPTVLTVAVQEIAVRAVFHLVEVVVADLHPVEAVVEVEGHLVVAEEDKVKLFLKKKNYEKNYIPFCNNFYCKLGLWTRRNGCA